MSDPLIERFVAGLKRHLREREDAWQHDYEIGDSEWGFTCVDVVDMDKLEAEIDAFAAQFKA